jgi:HAE1 family hydrophobic/amphiphilic exporter-1
MTTLVMASLLLAGFFGYRQLPIAAIPRIEVPTITVSVQYPGASPDTMAVSVAAPLERQFATIAGITAITSLSTQGNTQIALEFDLNRNIDAAALDVQSSISVAMARLPIDLPAPPAYRKVNPADSPIIFLALTSDTAQSQEMNEFADKVMSPKLSTLPGVAQINIQGAQKRAVRIKYDLDALATRGISVEEVRLAVTALSSVAPIGSTASDAHEETKDVMRTDEMDALFGTTGATSTNASGESRRFSVTDAF